METPGPATRGNARISRRLTILDVLVLIVALSLGLALARAVAKDRPSAPPGRLDTGTADWVKQSGPAIAVASRMVAMGMLGLLVIQLRPPQQALRRLSRQPGFVACAAGVAGLAAGGASGLALAGLAPDHVQDLNRQLWSLDPGATNLVPTQVTAWAYSEAGILPAIVAAWLALALGRRWRPVPTLLDRVGRVLGAYWILVYGFRVVAFWIEPTSYWIHPR
jgi:hypothetical protein